MKEGMYIAIVHTFTSSYLTNIFTYPYKCFHRFFQRWKKSHEEVDSAYDCMTATCFYK